MVSPPALGRRRHRSDWFDILGTGHKKPPKHFVKHFAQLPWKIALFTVKVRIEFAVRKSAQADLQCGNAVSGYL